MSSAHGDVVLEADEASELVLVFQFFNEDDVTPLNLTGASARFTLKDTLVRTDPATFDLAVGSGITLTALEGKVTVTISSDDMGGIIGNFFFELSVALAGGDSRRMVQGAIKIYPAVGNPA